MVKLESWGDPSARLKPIYDESLEGRGGMPRGDDERDVPAPSYG